MTWEDAEFTKIAINTFLAAQVDTTNRLAAAAKMVGANWGAIACALRYDARIGPKAYLQPGRWEDSRHLMRDHVTLCEIENADRS
jgi:UDPglucose 6-dehydrogenase